MESFGSVQSGKSSASLYVNVLEVTAATLIGLKHTWQGGTDKERHGQTDRQTGILCGSQASNGKLFYYSLQFVVVVLLFYTLYFFYIFVAHTQLKLKTLHNACAF